MIDFSEEFFEGETRDGFYIEPMMKHAWAAQMEVYMEIAEICNRHGIQYFADWGTLLGAVRHHGFVPWDDDMDIGMLRDDYFRFLKVAKEELPESYVVLSVHTDGEYNNMVGRVVNGDRLHLNEDELKKFHDCPFAVGIDIFPIDYIPRNKDEEEFQKQMIFIVLGTAKFIEANMEFKNPEVQKEIDDSVEQIEQLCGVKLVKDETLLNQLNELGIKLCAMYGADESDYVTSMVDLVNGWDYYVPKECYDSVIYMPFENIEIPVPVGYDKILTTKYGDYMTPVNQGGGHNYPFYKEQLEILKGILKEYHISGKRFGIEDN